MMPTPAPSKCFAALFEDDKQRRRQRRKQNKLSMKTLDTEVSVPENLYSGQNKYQHQEQPKPISMEPLKPIIDANIKWADMEDDDSDDEYDEGYHQMCGEWEQQVVQDESEDEETCSSDEDSDATEMKIDEQDEPENSSRIEAADIVDANKDKPMGSNTTIDDFGDLLAKFGLLNSSGDAELSTGKSGILPNKKEEKKCKLNAGGAKKAAKAKKNTVNTNASQKIADFAIDNAETRMDKLKNRRGNKGVKNITSTKATVLVLAEAKKRAEAKKVKVKKIDKLAMYEKPS